MRLANVRSRAWSIIMFSPFFFLIGSVWVIG
jgi:hypothetical protein